MDPSDIRYIVNHLFLPPHLPQEDDSRDMSLPQYDEPSTATLSNTLRGHRKQDALLSHVIESAGDFYQAVNHGQADQDARQCWRVLYKMLVSMQRVRHEASINSQELQQVIQNMEIQDNLCLLISKQNAGIILRRLKAEITLEIFQASATAAHVTGNGGKLLIQYPSRPRLSIPNNPLLIKSLSAYLATMDCTEMPEAIHTTRKAQSEQKESREVPDIRYMSELLGGIARALTPDVNATASSTVYVTKRINDHVLWHSALNPWRRDPQWLVIRVALQTSLLERKIDGRYGYKAFTTYVLARALEMASKAKLDHHLLYTMNVKIATRIWKLKSLDHTGFPFKYIVDESKSCGDLLKEQWRRVQEREASPLRWTVPTSEKVRAAEGFALARSRGYLSAVYNRRSELEKRSSCFDLEAFEATLVTNNLRETGLSSAAQIPTGSADSKLWLDVLDVEDWIINHIQDWQETTLVDTRLEVLGQLIASYDSTAISLNNPEQFSRVFLIILELWVALDKTAVEAIPLLREYSPEFSIVSFEPLLLPTLCQMRRLRAVEAHLRRRHADAIYHGHSLFEFIHHRDSFGARYFQTDIGLQNLREEIEREAAASRAQKQQECVRQNEEYDRLKRENDLRPHTGYEWVDQYGDTQWSHHSGSCQKCIAQRSLDSMRITIFEWPLPEDRILSSLVVFELHLPKPFSIWRDITYRLARTYQSSNAVDDRQGDRPCHVLEDYSSLKNYCNTYPSQEISIASTTKSFLVSHYRGCTFPCTEAEVVKNHPLQYKLYCVATREWISNQFPYIAIRGRCTPQSLPGPYESLRWTVTATGHTPNMVIASQSNCPAELSYHEWEAFGHVRSGHRLQWRNMMRELVTGTIALADPNVHLLFRQAAWQAEKASDLDHRESHLDLKEVTFGEEVIRVLRSRLDRISDNWQESWTASTLSVLACRLFSLSGSEGVRGSTLDFLSSLRQTVEKWLVQILRLLEGETNLAIDMRNRAIQLAATCRSTFALEPADISQLFEDPRNVSSFNMVPDHLSTLPIHIRYLVQRDIVLSVEVTSLLVQSILNNADGLDDAIHHVWEGFRRDPSIPWRPLGDSWIACKTFACYVHLNLLDGNFLVDGKTVGCLPKNILQHPLFMSVFPGQVAMGVVPSTMRGMAYQLSRNIKNQQVHFSMIGSHLVIRTRNVDSHEEVSEFVPHDKLQGDVPNDLLLGTVCRFGELSRRLEFYPAPSGWDPSVLPDWTMHFLKDPLAPTSHPGLMKAASKGVCIAMLSPESHILQTLSEVFRALESGVTNLIVTCEPLHECTSSFLEHSCGNLRIFLPRYKLRFKIGARGDIECENLPGLSIASTQSIGTLFGLKNKLILESKDRDMGRKVIVPDGQLKVPMSSTPNLPQVEIELPGDAGQKIRIFTYEVDELIGRLVGDGTLTSWYLLAYAHVLTSSHQADPLTHLTGVQQALKMLTSANSYAFTQLAAKDMELLKLIHALTPVRRYYPAHLKSMEEVTWNCNLSPLSQSEMFAPLVEAIVDHGKKQALFDATATSPTVEYNGNVPLRERAEYRNSRLIPGWQSYRIQSFEDYGSLPDRCLHQSSIESMSKERVVFETAFLVAQWTTYRDLSSSIDIWQQFKKWDRFSTRIDADLCINNPYAWLSKSPSETWFSLFSLCLSASKNTDMYGLVFVLGILSYRSDLDIRLVDALRIVATNTSLKPVFRQAESLLPKDKSFHLSPGHTLEIGAIKSLAQTHCVAFESSPQAGRRRHAGETPGGTEARRHNEYNSECNRQCESLAQYLFQQWPCGVVELPNTFATDGFSLIKSSFKDKVNTLFSSRFLNHRLFIYANKLRAALNTIPNGPAGMPTIVAPQSPTLTTRTPTYVPLNLVDLVRSKERLVGLVRSKERLGRVSPIMVAHLRDTPVSSIRELVSRFSSTNAGGFPSRYASDLLRCVDALETRSTSQVNDIPRPLPDALETLSTSQVDEIQRLLLPQTVPEQVLYSAGQWPSLGPECLLSLLSRTFICNVHHDWRKALIHYAEGLAARQRDARITTLRRLGLESELVKEAANNGGQGWEAMEYPDWLLIQLDANCLIRHVQASIAQDMMSPRGDQNTVMQLNMGEGKSSVIVPIISAALADGCKLVRVVVLKPLCTQMFHILKQRICGLANRRLYYLPFSRNVSLGANNIRTICDMFKTCAQDGGVLLCQPEHILSFQLMGLHLLCNTRETERASPFLTAQRWLDSKTRDILDESDELLSVRYQLIYTLGTPMPMQGQPDRWQIIQNVFSLLRDNLDETYMKHNGGLELQSAEPQRFPRTRILTHKCGRELLRTIAQQIVYEEKMPSTPFRSYPPAIRRGVFQFLTELRVTQADSDTLEQYSAEYFTQLLLLRGLIAHGVILLSLKEKRWRVDYGLDPSRSMLAVPYRAKDSPAPRAEFAHPDVVIAFTCLCYYYSGLSNQQLEVTFRHLLNSDDPSLRYDDWIKGLTGLPESLRGLQGLNLDDVVQKHEQIFPLLRYNKAVIDFYLSECVFPKECKEFEFKLTTNSWDLARKKTNLATGFSGTKDNSYLLPLSIHQLDSEDQRHTNAQVIEYLLRVENRAVVHTGSDITATDLIQRVAGQDPHTTVLLDVGAQVLELQNVDVAREWLKRDTHPAVEAAIYCDSRNDEFYVLTRDGYVEPLESSLYRTQLNKALVYLDEARTRGTDFKFPNGTRAVVTLGPKLSKDKLVQGCMRLRKLGSEHSVVFFTSSEIWRKIQASTGVAKEELDSSDVLTWALKETCVQIKDNGAHWASQGLNFDIRRTAWEKYSECTFKQSDLATVLREKESRTLKELYGVRENDTLFDLIGGEDGMSERQQAIKEKCQQFGIAMSRSSALLEEQERELAHEKEAERQVERVSGSTPLKHHVDPNLRSFIRSGRTSASFLFLSDCLDGTSQGTAILTTSRSFFHSDNLRATKDFSGTITEGVAGYMDDFLRAVTWILRSDLDPDMLLLISPFEANKLLPEIRQSKHVHLHCYSPRVSRQVPSFEDLTFFVVPPLPEFTPPASRTIHELNLFSGQLFFHNRSSFKNVCHMLGLHLGELPDELKEGVDAVGYVMNEHARERLGIRACAFHASPIRLLCDLIRWRRKGQEYTLTHVGQVLHGNNLKESEFD
ncbi:hypothetical protein JB92DRAFT_2869478 [Gautieria morchelliformis]|nr:hypothetical protein JB92DRAFT_2869478 [Gautieria morchelliformis]